MKEKNYRLSNLIMELEKISELKNISINEVAEQTTKNATNLFYKILN